MVWAQKNVSVLAVGVSFGSVMLPFGPALLVDHRTFEDAEAALENFAYSVMVVDTSRDQERAKRLAERARALHPNLRVIFAARRTAATPGIPGEMLVAGTGRQFVRGLRNILGC